MTLHIDFEDGANPIFWRVKSSKEMEKIRRGWERRHPEYSLRFLLMSDLGSEYWRAIPKATENHAPHLENGEWVPFS